MKQSLEDELKCNVTSIAEMLSKAEKAVVRVRKRHEGGIAYESHLAYAEGLRDGLQSAIDAMKEGQR